MPYTCAVYTTQPSVRRQESGSRVPYCISSSFRVFLWRLDSCGADHPWDLRDRGRRTILAVLDDNRVPRLLVHDVSAVAAVVVPLLSHLELLVARVFAEPRQFANVFDPDVATSKSLRTIGKCPEDNKVEYRYIR